MKKKHTNIVGIALVAILIIGSYIFFNEDSPLGASPRIGQPSQGQTGTSTIPAAGELLIGNGTNFRYDVSILTAGTNISITNADGSITIDSTASGVPFAWTPEADGNATSTTLLFKSGYISTASSTVSDDLTVTGQIFIPTGSITAPSIEASSFTTTGIYFRDLGAGIGAVQIQGGTDSGSGNPVVEFNDRNGTRIGFISSGGNFLFIGNVQADQSAAIDRASYAFTQDGNTGLGGDEADKVSLVTGGVARLVADSVGNVGIGTTTPESILHVDSGASATTTISFGDLFSGTGKGCVNMPQADGSVASFFIAGGVLVVETTVCK